MTVLGIYFAQTIKTCVAFVYVGFYVSQLCQMNLCKFEFKYNVKYDVNYVKYVFMFEFDYDRA